MEPAEETQMENEQEEDSQGNFLVSRQDYLASGIHIGMKQKSKQMKKFIYKIRPDGLAVMNIQMIDDRIRTAAKFLSKAKNIVAVSRKGIAHKAVDKFAEITGAHAVTGRFMPGTLTNPNYKDFYEADVVLIIDPDYDYQALKEAATARIPVIALSGTSNETSDVDLVIPSNNKSMRAIGTLLWILSKEILKERGKIKSDEEFTHKISEFIKESFRSERSSRSQRARGRGRSSRKRPRNRY